MPKLITEQRASGYRWALVEDDGSYANKGHWIGVIEWPTAAEAEADGRSKHPEAS